VSLYESMNSHASSIVVLCSIQVLLTGCIVVIENTGGNKTEDK